ncbi:bifunctional isochorismate lyase / aryl carrier protein [Andreprevotia lacus DSM 23236]|jgi:bifunctional isochorismate lyase/aryl carrier protein|uniref:isochorismatase n=1 Tax=Andreprevotia lacus DSM 23236 TaxID=1121001 RepID=A0A1W1XQW7_9NEIS|nr:isochorismatase family protein [Andreprevotia lacus]SMC25901.1 bifunctional isochorismate lyase / aryl carrier protein [Andreprevotia lacus DSM 23236]
MTIPRIATYPMPTADALPANRVTWQPDSARAVLLIHDLQQYFLDFYDASASPIPELLRNARALRDACDAAGVPVVYTAQPVVQSAEQRGLLNDWWGPGITAKPELYPVVEPVVPRDTDTVLTKWRYSAFAKSDLLQRLRDQGRDQLIVCGIYAHIGVMMTTADAFMNDVQAFMIGDAVADFSAEEHAMALHYASRRCGVVLSTAQTVAALAPKPKAQLPASLAGLREEVAKLLQVPVSDLADDDNLLDYGLDSIRLMALAERWRDAGADVGFVALAEQPVLARWWVLLQGAGC